MSPVGGLLCGACLVTLSTPLEPLHRRLGARMVEFAGYAMPVQYPAGIMAEHLGCRAGAGLFDVSHMGQATLRGPAAAAYLETLLPGDILGLKPGRQRYSFFTTDQGGISDDLMVAHVAAETYFLVVNASRKADDFALLRAGLPDGVTLEVHADRALLALQGPEAAAMLPVLAELPFMGVTTAEIAGVECWVSRSGYTGEDGFEISCPADRAVHVAEQLLADARCVPVGLGARDSLRLEAGLCLYGNDIDLTTNPVEAALTWAIGKRRRMEGGFVGAAAIARVFADGPARLRVGILPDGRAPARAGTPILAQDGTAIGAVTSGGYGPSAGAPIAMGYVRRDHAADGTQVALLVRGQALPGRIVPLPFVPHRYRR
jgi:aminomethyltransferase